MFRKVIVTVLAVTMMMFAAGLAYAGHTPYGGDIDGMSSDADLGDYDVYVNPGNLGDVLIYGYYNVRGYGNFFTIVNTSDISGVVARIRFREAKDSYEILDFNICLSANDMWSAFIVDDGTQARLLSNEIESGYIGTNLTLTAPVIPVGGVAFKHSGNGGLPGVTADETREGYYELIGLASIPAEPTSCPTSTATSEADVDDVLMGIHFMAEDATGLTFAYRAMALSDFNDEGVYSPSLGTETVGLNDGYDGFQGVDWAATKETINSEYMLELPVEAITGESVYVVTFFTKKLNVEVPTTKFGDAKGCGTRKGVVISVNIFDDKENSITTPEQFSPIITTQLELCYEVNVIELGNDTVTSDILNSGVEIGIGVGTFELGWIKIDLFNGVAAHSTCDEAGWAIDGAGDPIIGDCDEDETLGLPAWVWWLQTVDGVLSHGNEMAYTTDIIVY